MSLLWRLPTKMVAKLRALSSLTRIHHAWARRWTLYQSFSFSSFFSFSFLIFELRIDILHHPSALSLSMEYHKRQAKLFCKTHLFLSSTTPLSKYVLPTNTVSVWHVGRSWINLVCVGTRHHCYREHNHQFRVDLDVISSNYPLIHIIIACWPFHDMCSKYNLMTWHPHQVRHQHCMALQVGGKNSEVWRYGFISSHLYDPI